MPVIKVIGSGEPHSDPGSHTAAAVMAVTLAKASEPVGSRSATRKGAIAEKTRPHNPNRLTVDQHVFPSTSIERFADERGYVSLHDRPRDKIIRVKPRNAIFCASRAWDECTETGFMKRIEDDFQQIIGPIVEGKVGSIEPEQKRAVDRFYALWYMRARFRDFETQEVQLKGRLGGELTKEQEENLEKNGYIFARKDGKMPARHLNGIELQMRINAFYRDLCDQVSRWGVITTQSGEFIVPDVPQNGIIPVTPRLVLVHSTRDGMIVEQNLAEINRVMRAGSEDYFFARDFSHCPF